MSEIKSSDVGSSQDLPSRLQQLVDRFEDAWQSGQRPQIGDYLPPEDPDRRTALVELIHVDLERRLKSGEAVRVEQYLERYPDLAADQAIVLKLLASEFALRRRGEPNLSPQDYRQRFLSLGEALLAHLGTLLPQLSAPVNTLQENATMPPREGGNHDAGAEALMHHPRYRVLERLGSGGMGTVYKAEHRVMNRVVALKVINPQLTQQPDMVERFQREIKAAARLAHPNIVAAHDAEQTGQVHFLVMEFIEGINFARLLQERGRLPVAEACNYVCQAALGLQHAYECGMVHRDIKPQNLMRTPKGLVKILDFGLARFVSERPSAVSLTETGTFMGTLDYMAPEQAEDAHRADIRADIYSLGCTLYTLLAGHAPFANAPMLSKPMAHLERKPEPIEQLRYDVPPALGQVLERMMAKDPSRRYQTPVEVARDLAPFTTETDAPGDSPVLGEPLRSKQRGQSATRRLILRGSGAMVLSAVVALVVLVASVIYLGTHQGEPKIETDDSTKPIVQVATPPARPEPARPIQPAPVKADGMKRGDYYSYCGIPENDYERFIHRLPLLGYLPVFVSVFEEEGKPRFSTVAVRNEGHFLWKARHGMASPELQKTFGYLAEEGYRLVSVSGYPNGEITQFAAIWIKDGRRVPCEMQCDLTSEEYQKYFDAQRKKGLRPVYVTGYRVGRSHRLAAIFSAGGSTAWAAFHGLTTKEYQTTFQQWVAKGYRLISLSGYEMGAADLQNPGEDRTRFAAVFIRDNGVLAWWSDHDLSADLYEQAFSRWLAKGYRPLVITGYKSNRETRYAAIWVREWQGPLPVSGEAVPELAAFDEAMQGFMRERTINTGILAVLKDGRILFTHGYGFLDREDDTRLVTPDTPMRIASLTKPFTAAAVRKLIREGKVQSDSKAFTLLEVSPPTGQAADPPLYEITIQHLLDHQGGWDKDKTFDPAFRSDEIAAALGKPGPATSHDVIEYMTGQPLQFAPGSKSVYSNFGYCVLGRVIEKVTGQSYLDYIRSEILAPLGINTVEIAPSLPKDRKPGEPYYSDPGVGRNVVQLHSSEFVAAPDGTFHIEAMDSHGGLIASAPDLLRFFQVYQLNGQPRSPHRNGSSAVAIGSLPGTYAAVIQRPDGIMMAALFNQRADPSGLTYDCLKDVLNRTADKIRSWPNRK